MAPINQAGLIGPTSPEIETSSRKINPRSYNTPSRRVVQHDEDDNSLFQGQTHVQKLPNQC